MAYVINEPCIATKDTSCVEVCPVDCIHPTPDESGFGTAEMLYIDPTTCVDCGACVTACPVGAIVPGHRLKPEQTRFAEVNAAQYGANSILVVLYRPPLHDLYPALALLRVHRLQLGTYHLRGR